MHVLKNSFIIVVLKFFLSSMIYTIAISNFELRFYVFEYHSITIIFDFLVIVISKLMLCNLLNLYWNGRLTIYIASYTCNNNYRDWNIATKPLFKNNSQPFIHIFTLSFNFLIGIKKLKQKYKSTSIEFLLHLISYLFR